MITTTGKARQQVVSVDGRPPVAVLDHCKLSYALEGQDHVVRRVGSLTPDYQLWRGEDHLASLAPHWPRDRYTLTVGGREWSLRAEGVTARRYALFAGDDRVGEIRWAGRWFHMDLIADLPVDLPVEIQVFLVWFALYKFGDTGS